MAELMRTLIQVKDPLTLVAFLSVIGLLAFRTQKVPELVLGLAKDKLTKERFAQIVNRFMVYGLVVFFLLTGVAVAGQVLAYKTQARALSLDDLRKEMRQLEGTEEQKKAALEAYSKSLALLDRREFNQAIESLQASIQASPSVTAQYTLAYLYQKLGKRQEANQSAAAAQSLATMRNDTLAALRVGRLGDDVPDPAPAATSLIGDKSPFPTGGPSFEEAVTVRPGLYRWPSQMNGGELRYFKLKLKAGQKLTAEYRTIDDAYGYSGSTLYDSDGVMLKDCASDGRSERCVLETTADADGLVYLRVGSRIGVLANTVFRFAVQ